LDYHWIIIGFFAICALAVAEEPAAYPLQMILLEVKLLT